MRAFVALELPETMLDALETVQVGLPGRVVPRENLHLTLAFLGEVSEAVLAAVADGLAGLRLDAPVLQVRALDMFEGRRPDLVFASVAAEPELVAAREAVRRVCRQAGVALQRERFRPHVTLARFGKHGLSARAGEALAARLGPLGLPAARAVGLTLYRSELRADGPRYVALAGVPLD